MALSEIVARLPLPAEGLERSNVEQGRGQSLEEKKQLVEGGDLGSGNLLGAKEAAGRTTLMVRNLPLQYTQALVLGCYWGSRPKEAGQATPCDQPSSTDAKEGLAQGQEMLVLEWVNDGAYDFLYVPESSYGEQNRTYGFINFTSEEQATEFEAYWHMRRLAHFQSRKPLNIGFANVQGLSQNLLNFKRRWLRRHKGAGRHTLPLIFDAGVQVPSEHVMDAIRQEEQKDNSQRAVEQRASQAQSSHSGVAMASVQEEACTEVVRQDLEGILLYL